MSRNVWKSARNSMIRGRFWLYSGEVHQRQTRRAIQLRFREFETAEHLDLMISQAGSNSAGERTEPASQIFRTLAPRP